MITLTIIIIKKEIKKPRWGYSRLKFSDWEFSREKSTKGKFDWWEFSDCEFS